MSMFINLVKSLGQFGETHTGVALAYICKLGMSTTYITSILLFWTSSWVPTESEWQNLYIALTVVSTMVFFCFTAAHVGSVAYFRHVMDRPTTPQSNRSGISASIGMARTGDATGSTLAFVLLSILNLWLSFEDTPAGAGNIERAQEFSQGARLLLVMASLQICSKLLNPIVQGLRDSILAWLHGIVYTDPKRKLAVSVSEM